MRVGKVSAKRFQPNLGYPHSAWAVDSGLWAWWRPEELVFSQMQQLVFLAVRLTLAVLLLLLSHKQLLLAAKQQEQRRSCTLGATAAE